MKLMQMIEERRLVNKPHAVAKAKKGLFKDQCVAHEAPWQDYNPTAERIKANKTVTWVYDEKRRRQKLTVPLASYKTPGGKPPSDKTTG